MSLCRSVCGREGYYILLKSSINAALINKKDGFYASRRKLNREREGGECYRIVSTSFDKCVHASNYLLLADTQMWIHSCQ